MTLKKKEQCSRPLYEIFKFSKSFRPKQTVRKCRTQPNADDQAAAHILAKAKTIIVVGFSTRDGIGPRLVGMLREKSTEAREDSAEKTGVGTKVDYGFENTPLSATENGVSTRLRTKVGLKTVGKR